MNEFPRSTNYKNYWRKSVRIRYEHNNVQLQNKARNCAEKGPNPALKIQELITDHIAGYQSQDESNFKSITLTSQVISKL